VVVAPVEGLWRVRAVPGEFHARRLLRVLEAIKRCKSYGPSVCGIGYPAAHPWPVGGREGWPSRVRFVGDGVFQVQDRDDR
jgi:hypothetical protein